MHLIAICLLSAAFFDKSFKLAWMINGQIGGRYRQPINGFCLPIRSNPTEGQDERPSASGFVLVTT